MNKSKGYTVCGCVCVLANKNYCFCLIIKETIKYSTFLKHIHYIIQIIIF